MSRVRDVRFTRCRIQAQALTRLRFALRAASVASATVQRLARMAEGGIVVEVELEGTYPNGTILRGSWSVQRAKDVATQQELTNSPHQLVKLSASTPILASKLFANLELQYNSDSITLARTRSPSFWLTNFTLNTNDRWSKVELTAGVYNLFDEDHPFPGAEEHAQTLLQQEGRAYGESL